MPEVVYTLPQAGPPIHIAVYGEKIGDAHAMQVWELIREHWTHEVSPETLVSQIVRTVELFNAACDERGWFVNFIGYEAAVQRAAMTAESTIQAMKAAQDYRTPGFKGTQQ